MFWVIVFLQLWYTFLPVLCFPEGKIANNSSETALVKRRNLTCFHQPVESCPKPENRCRCHQLAHRKETAVCCDIVESFQLDEALACASKCSYGADAFFFQRGFFCESFCCWNYNAKIVFNKFFSKHERLFFFILRWWNI